MALCVACRGRNEDAFPLRRQGYSFSALWDLSWKLFQQHWLMLSVGVLIPLTTAFLLMMLVNVVALAPMALMADGGANPLVAIGSSLITLPLMFAVMVVVGAIGVGFFRMIQDAQDGRNVDVGRMFSQFSKIGRMLLGMFLIFVASFIASFIVGALVAAVGGGVGMMDETAGVIVTIPLMVVLYVAIFYFTLPFQFFLPELSLTDVGAIDALRNCWKITDGYRWQMVLLGLVFVPISMAGMMAFCVGVIPAYALMGLMLANMHRALRNGAEGVVGIPTV